MAVLAIFTGDVSKSQYEAVRKEVNWEREHPVGVILHAAGFDESGRIHVADVWESSEQLMAFFEERLMPAFQKLGITPPEAAVYPIHNLNAYASIGTYRL